MKNIILGGYSVKSSLREVKKICVSLLDIYKMSVTFAGGVND